MYNRPPSAYGFGRKYSVPRAQLHVRSPTLPLDRNLSETPSLTRASVGMTGSETESAET
jgi:hypothetical protein